MAPKAKDPLPGQRSLAHHGFKVPPIVAQVLRPSKVSTFAAWEVAGSSRTFVVTAGYRQRLAGSGGLLADC
jgi:hypothetical protein